MFLTHTMPTWFLWIEKILMEAIGVKNSSLLILWKNAPQIFNRGDANGVLKIFTFVLNLMFKLSIYIYIFSFATVIFSLSINWGWFVFLILNEEKFNQWTGFCMITASVMKKLKIFLEKEFFKCEKCGNKGPWCETSLLYFEITSRGKLH